MVWFLILFIWGGDSGSAVKIAEPTHEACQKVGIEQTTDKTEEETLTVNSGKYFDGTPWKVVKNKTKVHKASFPSFACVEGMKP